MFNKTKKKDKKYIDFIIELDYVEIILLKDITKEYFFFFFVSLFNITNYGLDFFLIKLDREFA